jgi:outer membrane protein OmpA-like peptidoglycan-associated protein
MNLFIKFITALILIVFVPAASVHADTVLLRNGDKLIGDIQNDYFAVQGSYGQIAVGRAFCSNIIMKNSQPTSGSLKTINNDRLSGNLLNKKILILLADGSAETVNIKDLKSLFIDESGPSHQVSTTIFTMNDGDRFSGKLLNPKIAIRTDYMAANYQNTDVNRIEFAINDADDALLLTTGDLIHGKLLLDKVEIAPDSFARLSLDQSNFSSIQFNTRKMLLKEYSSLADSEKDGDGDGVADDADNCHNTPWGNRVDENGCSTRNLGANADGQPGKKGALPQDIDGDGVPDDADQCLQTPRGAEVNKSGCWSTRDILFDFDSYLVKRQYYPALDNVLTVLQKNPTLKIEIQGSTDSIGSAEYNKLLSEKRAQTVKKYLIGKGIEPERLSAVGNGSTQKAASNETAAERALNRRIDFIIKEW